MSLFAAVVWPKPAAPPMPAAGSSMAGRTRTAAAPSLERLGTLAAMLVLVAAAALPWLHDGMMQSRLGDDAATHRTAAAAAPGTRGSTPQRETLLAAYGGAPWYYRSNVRFQRPDGTDLTLKDVGWDGDSLYFPIDGGARSLSWHGPFGHMVDFLHNKAVARLGKGAHGRKISNGVIETVDAEGTWKGAPAPNRIKLTDLVERMEFTHGHNMLFVTGLLRLAALSPRIVPYLGVGVGAALPHVEVWIEGEGEDKRTNEYQYAGPAAQLVAGLEMRRGNASYFLEYKFSLAWIKGGFTAGKSSDTSKVLRSSLPRWLVEPFIGISEFPGDMARQVARWWRGEPPRYGTFGTTLAAHGLYVGAGYWWQRTPNADAP